MTLSPERLASFTRWRTEIILTAAGVLGLGGLAHEFFLTSNPNWLKILASAACVAGVPAALLNLGGAKERS